MTERQLNTADGPSAFEAEQLLLHFQSSAIAAKRAIRGDNSMAGNDDRHRIGAVGRTHRAKSFGRPDSPSELRISADLAVTDLQQGVPAS